MRKNPLGEEASMPVPGLIHRYPDRCLILASRSCAVLCRHCNRKRLWSRPAPRLPRSVRFGPMFRYIAQTPSIREVILSGGDPLTLGDGTIDWLLGSLRGHSPRGGPAHRLSDAGVMPMRSRRILQDPERHRPLWFNHPFIAPGGQTTVAALACDRILWRGIPCQASVLLRGVNDDEKGPGDPLQTAFSGWGAVPTSVSMRSGGAEPTFSGLWMNGRAIMGASVPYVRLCLPRYVRMTLKGGTIPHSLARP
jgi:L-lysine 2,3-aminomutase